ncbi:MAG: DUF3311 domain-containing protein [Acidobacteriota bacterium]
MAADAPAPEPARPRASASAPPEAARPDATPRELLASPVGLILWTLIAIALIAPVHAWLVARAPFLFGLPSGLAWTLLLLSASFALVAVAYARDQHDDDDPDAHPSDEAP